jgi:DNA-binding CsgD family transcriptional regulator
VDVSNRAGQEQGELLAALGRLASFCELIAEAHGFGLRPGTLTLEDREFHLNARPRYVGLLKGTQLEATARFYRRCADQLHETPHDGAALTVDAHRVHKYLDNVASTLIVEGSVDTSASAETFVATVLLPNLAFLDLALLLSATNVVEMHGSAARLFQSLSHRTDEGAVRYRLTIEEVALLGLIANGRTMAQIGVDMGWSERSLYRQIRHVCRTLGVHSRVEAVAEAARLGLL